MSPDSQGRSGDRDDRQSSADFVAEAKALLGEHDYHQAVRVARLGLLAHPGSLEGRILAGAALTALGRADEVVSEMRVALEIAPRDATSRLLLGQALLQLGDRERARKVLARACELAPGNRTARDLLASCDEPTPPQGGPLKRVDTDTKVYPSSAEDEQQAAPEPESAAPDREATSDSWDSGGVWGGREGTERVDMDQIRAPDRIESVRDGAADGSRLPSPPPAPELSDLEVTANGPRPGAEDMLPVRLEDECTTAAWLSPEESHREGELDWAQLSELSSESVETAHAEHDAETDASVSSGERPYSDLDALVDNLLTTQRAQLPQGPGSREGQQSTARARIQATARARIGGMEPTTPPIASPPIASDGLPGSGVPLQFDPHSSLLETRPAPAQRVAGRESPSTEDGEPPIPDRRSATLLGWAAGPLEQGASLLDPLDTASADLLDATGAGVEPTPSSERPSFDTGQPRQRRRPDEATGAVARAQPASDVADPDFDDEGDDELEPVIRRKTPPVGHRTPLWGDDAEPVESQEPDALPPEQPSRQQPDPRSFSVDLAPHTREITMSSIHILPDSMPPVPPDGASLASIPGEGSVRTVAPPARTPPAEVPVDVCDDEHGTVDLDAESELVTHIRLDSDVDGTEEESATRRAPRPPSDELDLGQPALAGLPATLSTDGLGRDPAAASTELAQLSRMDDLSHGAAARASENLDPDNDPKHVDGSFAQEPSRSLSEGSSWASPSADAQPPPPSADWQGLDSACHAPARTASLQDGADSLDDSRGSRSAADSYQAGDVHPVSERNGWGWHTSGTEQLRGSSSSAYSELEPPEPARPARSAGRPPGGVQLSRRRRGGLGRRIAGALDPKSGHRTVVLTALGIGVVVSALGIGLLVRTLRVGQQSARTQKTALTRLRQGNLRDFQDAARMLRDIVSRAPKDRHAVLVQRCVSALIPFEFGVRTRDEAPPETEPGVADEYQSALVILGNLARGKLAEAGDAAFNARNLHPRSALLQYLQGRIELLKGKASLAAEYLTRADQLQRGSATVISALADACLAQGKHEEAAKQYDRALEVNPGHIASTLGQARVAIATGDHDKAKALLASILTGQRSDAASMGQKGWAYLLVARIHVYHGDIAEAQAQLREAWRHTPTQDPAFLDGLARLLMDAFRLGEAEEATVRAASMMPGRPYPLLLKAQVYLKQGRAQAALEVLEGSSVPTELSALLRARTYLALSQPTVARRELADAVKNFPELDVRLAEAEILVAQRDLERAETLLRDLASKHPDHATVTTALAGVLLARQNPREARSLLERVVQHDEGAIAAQLMLADVMLAEGKFRAAHGQLIRVTRKHSWLMPGSLRLAEINLGRRDTAAAATNLRAILKDNPNDQNARLLYLRVLIEQRDFLSAEQELLRLRGTAPGVRELAEGRLALAKEEIRRATSKLLVAQSKLTLNPEGPRLLAQAYLFEGKLDSARAVVKRMRRAFPSLPDSDASMGRVELGSARSAQAVRWLKRALKGLQDRVRQPAAEAEILVLLGRAHQDAEQVGEALANYQHAAKVCPFCPDPLFHQGLAHDELGRRKRAITLLTHAARLNPRLPQTYYELGKIHEAEGQAAQAVKMYKKYLDFGPPEDFAQNVRRAIENLGY